MLNSPPPKPLNFRFYFSGQNMQPDSWGFLETFLNEFVFTCYYKDDDQTANLCLEKSKRIREEFGWVLNSTIDDLVMKMTTVMVIK